MSGERDRGGMDMHFLKYGLVGKANQSYYRK